MDPDRNLFVLPSNAPTSFEYHSSSRGVLQNTSGNVQSNTLENAEVIPGTSLPTGAKGTCTEYQSQTSATASCQATVVTSRSRARLRIPFRKRHGHQKGPELTLEQEQWLKQRLATAGGFPTLTRSELRCDAYLKYRARQRKNLGKDGKPVWSDHLEESFQRAVREYRPPGRRKLEMRPQEKRQGSNEWISDYIRMMTGEERTRKQVSSHIQVLKKFLIDNVEWMSLVTTKETSNTFEDDSCSTKRARHVAVKNYEMMMQGNHFLNVSGTSMQSYMENRPPFEEALDSIFRTAPQCRVSSFDFKMWVNPPAPDNQRHEAFHVCTALPHDAQRAATPLEHIPNWRSLYPDLAPLSEDADFDCNLVFMESKLDLMTDSPPTGSRLGIDFFARIANGSAYEVWDYSTVFYEKGRSVHKCSGELRFTVEGSTEGIGTTKLEMSLESSWWVKFFFKASERRRVREARGDVDALQQVDENTRRSLKELSVMQEFWATSYANRLPRKRVAVVLWKFRQVRPGEAAITRWRDLIPPPPRITTNSPAPAMLESQMTLDNSINNHMHQPVAIYTDAFHQQSFDSFGACPDPAPNSQDFDDYGTSGDAFPGPSGAMDFSMSNIDVKQEDLGSVDFSEGHINLYCEAYSQPPPAYGAHAPFVASEETMQEGYDDHHWAAMCPHPAFADMGFEHANGLPVADTSEHVGADFTDVGFEHGNLPDVPEKVQHDNEDFTDVGFQHDNISQVAAGPEYDNLGFKHVDVQHADFALALKNSVHANQHFTDVGLEHANPPDVPGESSRGNDPFTDVGFEHTNLGETAEQPEHNSEHFADVGFEHTDLPDVSERSRQGSEIFTDVGFEHVHLPDLPDTVQHDNDGEYEHVPDQSHGMAFD